MRRVVAMLTDHFWCGNFLPDVSMVAYRSSGTLVGVLIASRVAQLGWVTWDRSRFIPRPRDEGSDGT
jgi:hypothetical protein